MIQEPIDKKWEEQHQAYLQKLNVSTSRQVATLVDQCPLNMNDEKKWPTMIGDAGSRSGGVRGGSGAQTLAKHQQLPTHQLV